MTRSALPLASNSAMEPADAKATPGVAAEGAATDATAAKVPDALVVAEDPTAELELETLEVDTLDDATELETLGVEGACGAAGAEGAADFEGARGAEGADGRIEGRSALEDELDAEGAAGANDVGGREGAVGKVRVGPPLALGADGAASALVEAASVAGFSVAGNGGGCETRGTGGEGTLGFAAGLGATALGAADAAARAWADKSAPSRAKASARISLPASSAASAPRCTQRTASGI